MDEEKKEVEVKYVNPPLSEKAITFMTNGSYTEQSNHARRLELQAEIKAGLPRIKKARNRRRNLRRLMRTAW